MMQRKRAMMSREVWDTIIQKYVVPYWHLNEHLNPPTLIPSKDGEPLLHKKLPEYLKAASDLVPGITFSIYTHGLRLTEGFLAFLGSLPNRTRLIVSFHFYNHDGTTNDYTQTDALLRSWLSRPKLGPENIEYIFASHLIAPMTSERLNEWKGTWRQLENDGRVTVHANVRINPWTGLITAPGTIEFGLCPYENFDHMFFGATGNVLSCCMDLEEEIQFGNVMKDKPEDMVRAVSDFYAAQRRHEVKHDVCNNCFGLPPREKLVQVGVA